MSPEPDPGDTGKVNITPADLASSAKAFYNAQTDLFNAWYALQTTLDDNSGMAGNDDLANKFNGPYSKGTKAAWSALRSSMLTLGGVSMGLTRTANNFVTADHKSTAGKKGPATLFAQEPVTDDISMADTDSAIGSGDGVWFLPGPLSRFWPNADTGKLRNAAKAWHDAATAVDTLTRQAGSSLTGLETTDDSVTSINAFWGQVYTPGDNSTILAGTHQICQSLGDACGKYADAIDSAHSQIKDALIGAGIAVGLTTAIGAVASFFTGGGAAPLTGAADEAEVEGIAGPVIADAVVTVGTETAGAIGEDLISTVEGAVADTPTVALAESETTEIDGALDEELADAEGETPEELGLKPDYTTPKPGTPEYQARLDELSQDPAHGGASSPKTLREAEVGLQAEANGDIPGPITRAPLTPEGLDQGEFIDANGQTWDVKSSPDVRPSSMPGAGTPINNPQSMAKVTSVIDGQLSEGQNVLLDPDGMTPGRLAQIQQLVNDNPAWRGKVFWGK